MLCFASIGCAHSYQTQQDDRMNVMSPDVPAELVYFFKKGTDWKEVLEFERTVTGFPSPNGTGWSDLPGMMTGVRIDVNGYEGEAINFQPNATDEQKAFVKKRVSESPLIYKIYENVIPSRISDLNTSGEPAPLSTKPSNIASGTPK